MGNYKFRLSDMMPNAWFYKLKDMGSSNRRRRTRNQKNTNTATNSMKKKQPNSTPTSTPKPNQPHHHYHISHSRKSYYFTRDPITSLDTFYNSLSTNTNATSEKTAPHFPDHPPRKSPKQFPNKNTRKKSAAAGCNCRASFESDFSPEFSVSPSAHDTSSPDKQVLLIQQSPLRNSRSDESLTTTHKSFDGMVAWSSSCVCKSNSNAKDFIIDMDNNNESPITTTTCGFDSIPEIDLPRIITKPAKFNEMVNEDITIKETKKQGTRPKTSSKTEERKIELKEHRSSPARRFSGNSPGMRLRVKSPRIANMTTQGRRSVSSSSSSSSRRSISESFAVVKSSFNPQKDFKESMMEMIVENNIRASKDLEELLACYLSLNSDEYHDLIIKVFKQIWFDLTDIQRK